MRAPFQHDGFGPALIPVAFGHVGDGLILASPEQVSVPENGSLAEQVGQHGPVIGFQIEQRLVGGDAAAACEPVFQLLAARGVFVFRVQQGQPVFLLLFCGERQGVKRPLVDDFGPVERLDIIGERRQRQHPAHHEFGDAEALCNHRDGLAF